MAERRDMTIRITKSLLAWSGAVLVLNSIPLFCVMGFLGDVGVTDRILWSFLVFNCGVIGGFVSIQQRLSDMEPDELQLLSGSWASVLVVPLFGGIFALVLYVIFLTEIITVPIFPEFDIKPFSDNCQDNVKQFFNDTCPSKGQDVAKLMFWSFVAGFSERFVPKIVKSLTDQVGSGDQGPHSKTVAGQRNEPSPRRSGIRLMRLIRSRPKKG